MKIDCPVPNFTYESFVCWRITDKGIERCHAIGKDDDDRVFAQDSTLGFLGQTVFMTEREAKIAEIKALRILIQRHALQLNRLTKQLNIALIGLGE